MLATVMLGLALAGGRAGAAPGDPFGGDDTGFIPPDATTQKCESKVGKTLATFVKCVEKCHVSRAKLKLAVTPVDAEDGCEAVCEGKYDISVGKLSAVAGCPPACMSPVSIRSIWEGLLDGNNNQIYCDAGTAFGGEDTGFIPSAPAFLLCETKLGGLAAKLVGCYMKCHASRSTEKLDPTGEDGCETSCTTAFSTKASALTGCPPCLNTATLATTLLTSTNNDNGLVYCAN
ncbi:MAG TPA: hypothetical protein VKW76_02970 [Candidatus Binatia bacterium]|nr:hypothetical protein [Candidatus Binatia bacterium]